MTSQPHVLDHTALVALFDAQSDLMRLWRNVDAGAESFTFPGAAIAEANHLLGATDDAWAVLLWPPTVEVVPLDRLDAIASGRVAGGLAVRHTVAVSRAVDGIIVTRAPWQYPPDAGPMLVI